MKTDLRIIDLLNSNNAKKDIVVNGWVRTRRDAKTFSFIELNDGSIIKNIQVIADSSLSNYESEIKKLNVGSSICVKGDLVESKGQGQSYEIQAKEISVYGFCDPEKYPLQKKGISLEVLRSVAHLRPRTNTFGAVFRIRSRASYAIHNYFQKKGFIHVHTPIITGSDCEGAGEMFRVTTLDVENPEKIPRDKSGKVDISKDFFGKETNLTVSGQLEGELFAMSHGLVYTFGPTFRAENSNTYRHAAEFWMIEPEMSFYDINDLMDLEEDFLKYLVKDILENCNEDMEFFNKWIDKGIIDRLNLVLSSSFERLMYTDAIKILEDAYAKDSSLFDIEPEWGIDLGSEHEKYLTDTHFKKPVFLYNYPIDIKAFYMKQNEDKKTVGAVDLLVPTIGELVGGSQREDDYDKLIAAIKHFKLNLDDYSWYLDTRKFGSVPHSGFGLGFERFLMFVTGIQNIRDVIPFPRTPGNAEF